MFKTERVLAAGFADGERSGNVNGHIDLGRPFQQR
jgi:hypothetical protein